MDEFAVGRIDNAQQLHDQQRNDSPIADNLARAQAINLPVFVQPDRLKTKDYSIFLSPDGELEPARSSFKVPFLVRANRLLQVGLIALCAIVVLAYSLDVIMSHDVMLRQEQVRRLSEQNSELSARLLKSISFQGIQKSVLGHGSGPCNLRVAEEVLIAKEVPPVQFSPFKPGKHHLPLLSGY